MRIRYFFVNHMMLTWVSCVRRTQNVYQYQLYSRNRISMHCIMQHHNNDMKTNFKCRLISIFVAMNHLQYSTWQELCDNDGVVLGVECFYEVDNLGNHNKMLMLTWALNAFTKLIICQSHYYNQGSFSLLMMWIRNVNMK